MKNKSFTLIEVLIVISIIGILTAISVTSYNSSRLRSRDVARKASILNISQSLEQYKSANNVYAPQYAAALGANACQENAAWDATGLGDCYWGVNNPSTFTNSDPLFVTDTRADATSAYLLPFMAKPKAVSSTIPSALGEFVVGKTTGANKAKFSDDTINYRVQNSYYVVRAALENKSTSCAEGYDKNNLGYLTNDTVTPNKWRESTYPAVSSEDCNDSYKIFQKSSLSSLR
jgi:prepilin-type N-terminal cleavage/methylation domain-containing protein